MNVVGQVIEGVVYLFIGLLWIRLVTDWMLQFARSWEPKGPLLVLLEGAYSATDPPLLGLRKVIKPVRIGGISLDLAFVIVMVLAYVVLAVNRQTLLA
ncbi:YggT family protein [Nocardioides montaniterrae]